jgi:hypothetical protein
MQMMRATFMELEENKSQTSIFCCHSALVMIVEKQLIIFLLLMAAMNGKIFFK